MNRDDIIRMARECGLTINDKPMLGVEHFAKLIAAAEREACALLCERHANEWRHLGGLVGPTAEDIAARIRARGDE